jgi:hypothetical protein
MSGNRDAHAPERDKPPTLSRRWRLSVTIRERAVLIADQRDAVKDIIPTTLESVKLY